VADPELSRLKWRCRRGMKELDLLLLRWLERGWPRADAERRRAFEWLLEQPDPDLADWLLGGLRPIGHARASLVDDILRLPA
jgi:antitoxin CptB